MAKEDGAFLTIGELARELGVAQHILRYWESRFPQLRPLQRSGNRRYYRPADVDLARRINRLLNEEGFTVRGAQRALSSRRGAPAEDAASPGPAPVAHETARAEPASSAERQAEDRPAEGRAPAARQPALPLEDLFSSPRMAQAAGPAQLTAPDLAVLIARLTVIRKNLEDALNPG